MHIQRIISKNITPHLGHLPLSTLRPEEIRVAYSRMEESGRCCGQGGLSRRTVQHSHRLLRKALKQAVEDNRVLPGMQEEAAQKIDAARRRAIGGG